MAGERILIVEDNTNLLKERALKAGAVAFLQKPVDNDELLAAIRRTLRESAEVG